MCENIDANIGRVLAKLHEWNIAENTIVIYLSDNGPNSPRWNGAMKGIKGSVDEGGVRSPFLIRWPARIPAGRRVKEIASAIDLLPTIVEWAGVKTPPRKPLDGVSLAPLLTGEGGAWPERLIFSHWGGKMSVRSQRHRYHASGTLHDMEKDPAQLQDIAAAEPGTTAKLRAALEAWRGDMAPGLTPDDRPFTAGHPTAAATPLPARDGVPHGGVKRSAPAPNDSHFVNWASPDDRITWDAEILTAGTYEVLLHYTCSAENTGAVIQFAAGDVRTSAPVTEPHDPPLRGAAEDRVPRKAESYVKPFKALPLGTVSLPAGRMTFELRALSIPGKLAADTGGITLRRIP
jgi:Sulfatase